MKKMRSLLVAGALTLSVSAPAFAAIEAPEAGEGTAIETIEGGVTGSSVVSEGTFELPTIKVTLPTTHGFIVNPYNLENAGQIVSSTATIKNESDVAVDVYLKSATAEMKGSTDTKKLAVLGLVTDKITTKTVELNLLVTADEGKGTVAAASVNITGKNTNVKLVSLPETTGEASLKYGGKAVANPVGNPWIAEDEIKVTSVYTFTPAVVTQP